MEQPNGSGRELHLEFTGEFRGLNLPARQATFQKYVENIHAAEEDERERQGMLTILQIVEQLMPHLAAGEISIEEPIVVQIQSELQSLAGLGAIESPGCNR